MLSSTSNFEKTQTASPPPPSELSAPLSVGLRKTASERPGVAQPVPERDIPERPWPWMLAVATLLVAMVVAGWEWRAREIGYEAGDLGDDPSAWAEQRRRLDAEHPPVAIIGDSRILYDTDLDRFERMTGLRPVQLALEGTNARALLQDVADRSSFDGLLIVGIAEAIYYWDQVGLGSASIERGKWEAPTQRASFLLGRALRRHLAFLDKDNSLSTLVGRLDRSTRKGAYGPNEDVWKVGVAHDDRQFWLWPAIETNPMLRDHTIRTWMALYGTINPTQAAVRMTEDTTRDAVAKIRARGGDVVFVRPPSAPPLRAIEDQHVPREKVWDKLLLNANVKGVHADDLSAIADISIPEYSHVRRACATVFTDAYLRALITSTPRLRLLPTAPTALDASSCAENARSPSSH
jgi:hypothetical protein